MKRIDSSTASVDKFGTGKNGFTAGNVQLGVKATSLTMDWFDAVQEELMAVIEGEGLTPSGDALSQLYLAIKYLIQKGKTNYAADSGTAANVYKVNLTPAVTTLVDGMEISFQPNYTNTGASTLSVNGLTAYPIAGGALSALQGGEIPAAGKVKVKWHAASSSFFVTASTGPRQVANAVQSQHAISLGQMNTALEKYAVLNGSVSQKFWVQSAPGDNAAAVPVSLLNEGLNKKADLNAFVSSRGIAGYRKLPDGTIKMWGICITSSLATGAGAAWAVSLPTAFPTAMLSAQASLANGALSGGSVVSVMDVGTPFTGTADNQLPKLVATAIGGYIWNNSGQASKMFIRWECEGY